MRISGNKPSSMILIELNKVVYKKFINVMKIAYISPLTHLKCIYLIALRITSFAECNEKSGIPDKCQQPKLIERIVLWYEFDSNG